MGAAFVKSKIWPAVNYVPHTYQEVIHNNAARHRIASAGRRFGKSQIGGHELTVEGLRTYSMRHELAEQSKRREFWIVGPEYTDSEKEFRVVWDDFKRLDVPFDKPGSYNNPESGEMVISLWDRRFIIHAKSAKYPATLVGEGLSGVVMAEAAKLKQVVWTKYIRPTLADFRGWSLWLSTPEGKNWFYELYRLGQDPKMKDWASWRMPSWFNSIVFPLGELDPEIADMKSEMSDERFNQEVVGLFTDFVGRVFKSFDEEVHVKDIPYDPRWPLYACCDYGWTNPFVWLLFQVDVFDNVYIIGEYRTNHTDTNDIARDLQTWREGLSTKVIKFFPDPASPGDSAILSKALRVPFAEHGTGGELRHRLEYIRQYLKPVPETAPEELRMPKLLIDRSCVGLPLDDGGLIREMQDYRFPDRKEEQNKAAPEEPLKKDDHGPEALGRGFLGLFGNLEDEGRAHARVSRARVG